MELGGHRASRYDPAQERAYHLSILLEQGLSAWAVHRLDDGSLQAMAWAPDLEALKDEHIAREPVTVSFISLPEWSTLVPDGALAPGSEAKHLALVHGGMPSGAMRDEPVSSLGATCIYVHDDRSERAALERFPHSRALPMQALMVRTALARSSEGPLVLIHRGTERLDVAVAEKGRLLLSNTYPARTGQDLLYFALLATERCGFRPEAVELQYGGAQLTAMERELLGRYFQRCIGACGDPWSGDEVTDGGPMDRWMAVLEQFACVS